MKKTSIPSAFTTLDNEIEGGEEESMWGFYLGVVVVALSVIALALEWSGLLDKLIAYVGA